MASPWSADSVVTAEQPGGLGNLHFLSLKAGARVVSTVRRKRAWFWMSRVTVVLRGIFPGSAKATFRIFGSRLIEIALADDYWIPAVMLGHAYEPEILAVLSKVLGPDSFFIDAGANVGWWSLFASTIIAEPSRIVAIEPAASTFGDLLRNARLNNTPFTCERAAVWSEGGKRLPLRFSSQAREGAHLECDDSPTGQRAEQVELVPSVSIDEIIERTTSPFGSLVLKLDVEGAEVQALEGLRGQIDKIDLIIYEDHGKDPHATVTDAILGLGFEVFFSDSSGQMRPVVSAEDAQKLKPNVKIGYNFFAACPESRIAAILHGQATARLG
jgi:FkbM family methyltransferase